MAYTNKQFIEDFDNLVKTIKKSKREITEDLIFSYLRTLPTIGSLIRYGESISGSYAAYTVNENCINFSSFFMQDFIKMLELDTKSREFIILFRKISSSIYHEYQHSIDLNKIRRNFANRSRGDYHQALNTVSPTDGFSGEYFEKMVDYFYSGIEFNAFSVTIATMVSVAIHKNKKRKKSIPVLIDEAILEYSVGEIPLNDILKARPNMEKIFKRKIYTFLHSKLVELSDRSKLIQLKLWFSKSSITNETKKVIFDELVSKIKDIKFGQDNSDILSKDIYFDIVRSKDDWLAKTIVP